MRQTISLHDMSFYAQHGYYEVERTIGGWYVVNVDAIYDFPEQGASDDLDVFVNYEKVYNITKQVMEQPVKLIETLAKRIIDQIIANFPTLDLVVVEIEKKNPPLGGQVGSAKIRLERKP